MGRNQLEWRQIAVRQPVQRKQLGDQELQLVEKLVQAGGFRHEARDVIALRDPNLGLGVLLRLNARNAVGDDHLCLTFPFCHRH
jgi:hypothetical protein